MKMTAKVCILVLVLTAGSIWAEAALDISGSRYDFGSVPQNATISQYFWFKSIGTDTLRISEVKTGCDCATMPFERQWIAPGDSMLVGLFWKTEKRIGGIGRYPYVMTNARPEPYRIFLTADVTVKPDSIFPICARPFILSLAKTATTSIDSLEFRLVNRSDQDVALRIVSHIPNQVELNLPTMIKAKSEIVSYVKVKPEFVNQEFTESVTLMTDDSKETRVTIPIARKIYTTTK
jgi:hypothetical protein